MAKRNEPDGDGSFPPARDGALLAKMAATIAAGVEANAAVDWDCEDVAHRAVSVAEAILSRVAVRP